MLFILLLYNIAHMKFVEIFNRSVLNNFVFSPPTENKQTLKYSNV